MSGALFDWATPIFVRAARRWTLDDARDFADMLEPFLTSGGRILDVGGGTGHLAALLAEATAHDVVVLDRSSRMLASAAAFPGVSAVQGDAVAMPFDAASFDAAIVVDALHHMDRQHVVAGELARVVRPGGGLVVADEDAGGRGVRLVAFVERLLGEPAAFLTAASAVRLFAEAGFDGAAQARGASSYVFIGARDIGSRPDRWQAHRAGASRSQLP